MNKKIFSVLLTFLISIGVGLQINAKPIKTEVKAKTATAQCQIICVNPLDVVANPNKYINKKIKVRAKFDKFSTLGLDYKPAYKSSEKYITFLIKRDDVINNVVPLSEMKNFIERKTAEQYIDLKPGDEIEYTGTVFSNALSDVWVNVETFKVIKEVYKEKTTQK